MLMSIAAIQRIDPMQGTLQFVASLIVSRTLRLLLPSVSLSPVHRLVVLDLYLPALLEEYVKVVLRDERRWLGVADPLRRLRHPGLACVLEAVSSALPHQRDRAQRDPQQRLLGTACGDGFVAVVAEG